MTFSIINLVEDGRTCQQSYKIKKCLDEETYEFYLYVSQMLTLNKYRRYKRDSSYDNLEFLFQELLDSKDIKMPDHIKQDYVKKKLLIQNSFDLTSNFIYPFFDSIIGIEEGERFNTVIWSKKAKIEEI